MMLNNGASMGSERILSRPAVEAMTTDQLTPEQKASAGFFLGDGPRLGFRRVRRHPAQTMWRRFPGGSAGTAAWAPPGIRIPGRI